MKKIVAVITLIFICLSCRKTEETPVNYVILSGNVSNTVGGSLKIRALNGFNKTINVKNTGTFTDTLYIEENGIYKLRFDDGLWFAPYLAVGSKIHLSFDAKKPENTLKISGNYNELNNYYAYKLAKNFNFRNTSANYKVDESTFENNIKIFQKDLEDKLASVKNIPDNIRALEIRSINYNRLNKKLNYQFTNLYENKDFKVSNAFEKELLELSFDNEKDYLYSEDYEYLVTRDIQQKFTEYYSKDSLSFQEAQMKALSEIENESIRNTEQYKNILRTLSRSPNKDETFETFINTSTNEKHKASIKKLYASLKVLDAGQPSPKFENYETHDGRSVSLQNFKGKYVYIDVWATWCGPCIYEIPFLKKVKEKYHGKNIEFVGISVDKEKDKAKWKEMVAEKDLKGIQLIADKDFNSKFITDYQISGIPRFILIDTEGKIVNANAPRPSNEKLVELFDSLNI